MARLNRRQLMQAAGLGLFGCSASGWLPAMASELAQDPRRQRRCILLWMAGGPSQTDTFDMKPNHENGDEFKEVATNVPGIRISEHLPKLAQHADKLAIVRGLSTKEGDHGRGTYLMRTGHAPMGKTRYPTIGSSLSTHLGSDEGEAPAYVSIAPYRAFNQAAFGPGFLGPKHAPLIVGAADTNPGAGSRADADGYAELHVDDLNHAKGVDAAQAARRMGLLESLQDQFIANHRAAAVDAQRTVYRRAVRLMNSDAARAFDLTEEPDEVRDAYGKGRFGQGCLMARRWLERGVSFVEVSLGGNMSWDTHANNFATVEQLSEQLDAGWGTLMSELDDRGLLESTTILWMGEFGRTPRINSAGGRDHYPRAWSCVLAGGGIQGGQTYGRTSDDGMTVEDGKVGVGDVLATLSQALGVPAETQIVSETGRPFPIADGSPITKILA